MKKNSIVFWIIGLCAFVALMCSGLSWVIGLFDGSLPFLAKLEQIAGIILTVTALITGWLWLSSCKINKTFKLILQILFIIFAVLAVCGYIGVSF